MSPTQADRRARSRAALLEATARAVSRHGYGQLRLQDVAAEAGYTRGALYHQFRDKDDLVLATIAWVRETWFAEVGSAFDENLEPVEALVELARRHAVFGRRDVAGVMTALRVEFAGREHPVGAAVHETAVEIVGNVRRLVVAGRRDGTIPPGPAAVAVASAALSAIEAVTIVLTGRPDDDEVMTARVVRGVLGVPPSRFP